MVSLQLAAEITGSSLSGENKEKLLEKLANGEDVENVRKEFEVRVESQGSRACGGDFCRQEGSWRMIARWPRRFRSTSG